MFQQFVQMTGETMPLGLPHDYGGGPGVPGGGACMALRWPTTDRTISDVASFGDASRVDDDTLHRDETGR